MLRSDKEKVVGELKEKLSKSQSLFLTDFTGLKVEEINQLRRDFKENKVELKVTKNTLLRLAAKEAGVEGTWDYLNGPTGVVFGYDDPVIAAKLLYNSIKKIEKPKIKVFLIEGQLHSSEEIKKLASIPPREILLAQIISGLDAPLTSLIGTLEGVIREFLGTLDGIVKAKSE
jgi:large subunit ribosomal protein L10